ncbi:hypothetical protein [Clostridium combesii]|uniref:Uncharacterized protein n=1 Tax=Clostridium combesii TaxID=39481 RepID=A0A2G7HJB7_9CLOT|nr:hypothetical protein [Clostridium combesii]PIH05220.1 hypothetical protein CS538_05165 [Clostridium combesii]
MKSIDIIKTAIEKQDEAKTYLSKKMDKLKTDKTKIQENYNAALLEDNKKSDKMLSELKDISIQIDTIEEQLQALKKENPALKNIGKNIYFEGYDLTQNLKKQLKITHDSMEMLKEIYENEMKELNKKESELLSNMDDISQKVFNYRKYMNFIPSTVRMPMQLDLKNINLLEDEKHE